MVAGQARQGITCAPVTVPGYVQHGRSVGRIMSTIGVIKVTDAIEKKTYDKPEGATRHRGGEHRKAESDVRRQVTAVTDSIDTALQK